VEARELILNFGAFLAPRQVAQRFQEDDAAFHSYGKIQGEVGPVGAPCRFSIYICAQVPPSRGKHNRQRLQITDATTFYKCYRRSS